MKLKLPRVNKYAAMLVLAVALAGLAVWLAYTYLQQKKDQYQSELQSQLNAGMVQVVVPTRDLQAGMIANGANMAQRLYPRDLIYSGTITASKWVDYAGRALAQPVQAGKPLLQTDFVYKPISDFASTLPATMRAVTINVDDLNSISGLIRPGDSVDVLLAGNFSDQNQVGAQGQQGKVLPLLHQVKVLATGPSFLHELQGTSNQSAIDAGGGKANSVLPMQFGAITLEVSPDQASELVLAQQVGSLRVVLSSQHHEPGSPGVPSMSQDQLLAKLGGNGSGAVAPGVQYIIGGGTEALQGSYDIPAPNKPVTPDMPPAGANAAVKQQAMDALKTLMQAPASPPQSSH